MSTEQYEPAEAEQGSEPLITDKEQQSKEEQSGTAPTHSRRDFLKMAGGAAAAGALASPGVAEGKAFFMGLDSRLLGASVSGRYRGKSFQVNLDPPPKNAPNFGYGAGYIKFDIKPTDVTSGDDLKIQLSLQNPSRRLEYIIPGSAFKLWIDSRRHIQGDENPVDLSFLVEISQEKSGKSEPVFSLTLRGTADSMLHATTGVSSNKITVLPVNK